MWRSRRGAASSSSGPPTPPFPASARRGGFDAYLRQYGPDGAEQWTKQFGGPGDDYGVAVAVGPSGRVAVVGSTERPAGRLWAGTAHAFLHEFDLAGTALWSQRFGTETSDDAWGVAIDADGNHYITGSTERSVSGQRAAGRSYLYLSKFDAGGRQLWTRQFGTGTADLAVSLALDESRQPRIAGSTRGTLPGQTSAGERDAYVMSVQEHASRSLEPAGSLRMSQV